ncbi:MAG TPA: hypothetical protein PLU64_05870 [Saprospiraceae bacterium]|nr:hypothetical protein [Lewinellaceae bacterium]HQU58699.1 hypothetical protein [Saprospiraceae bacterium]
MKRILIISSLLAGLLAPGNVASSEATEYHAFHISKCLIDYNEAEQALQISMHLFLDDLEEALRRQGADKLFLCTPKETSDAEAHLVAYLKQHFRLRVNGKERAFTFIGKETSEDLAAVWCYLEVPGVQSLQELEVANDLLMEAYEDQKNVVSINGPGHKQGMLLLQKGNSSKKASF